MTNFTMTELTEDPKGMFLRDLRKILSNRYFKTRVNSFLIKCPSFTAFAIENDGTIPVHTKVIDSFKRLINEIDFDSKEYQEEPHLQPSLNAYVFSYDNNMHILPRDFLNVCNEEGY